VVPAYWTAARIAARIHRQVLAPHGVTRRGAQCEHQAGGLRKALTVITRVRVAHPQIQLLAEVTITASTTSSLTSASSTRTCATATAIRSSAPDGSRRRHERAHGQAGQPGGEGAAMSGDSQRAAVAYRHVATVPEVQCRLIV
jgi:hypothetical protein